MTQLRKNLNEKLNKVKRSISCWKKSNTHLYTCLKASRHKKNEKKHDEENHNRKNKC